VNIELNEAYDALKFYSEFTGMGSQLPYDDESAVITHWLHRVSDRPVVGGSRVSKEWREFLKLYASQRNFCGSKEARVSFKLFPFPPPRKPKFKFIDIFAGIGGFRLGLQALGGKCVFSCEKDARARRTYFENFGEIPFNDICNFTKGDVSDFELDSIIPNHDVLAAGFPCQPFSKAGIASRLFYGHSFGLKCKSQGNLFRDIVRIAKVKRPKVILLENVRNLVEMEQGALFEKIRNIIEKDLGYSFSFSIISSSAELPQKRERCYIVCLKNGKQFEFPKFKNKNIPLKTILQKRVSKEFTISNKRWSGHKRRNKRNKKRGVGFQYCLADKNFPSKTLVARYGKDGKECLIPQEGKNPRMLTPRECARLQGFPDKFTISVERTSAYRQFGNAVSVPIVKKIGKSVLEYM